MHVRRALAWLEVSMRSPNSFVLEALARARHQAAFDEADRESRHRHGPPDPGLSQIVGNASHVLPPLAYLMVISLAAWGVAHVVDAAPRSSPSACVTSGFRPLVSGDIRGTGEVCAAAATARANVYVDQLQPGGTYTILLLHQLDPATACPTACVPDPGTRALLTWTVRVVDTTNADDFGRLQDSQEVSRISLAHGSMARLVLMEFVRRPASQLEQVAMPTVGRHTVDRLPDVDSDTAVADALFQVP
jgi:hypothetical protein